MRRSLVLCLRLPAAFSLGTGMFLSVGGAGRDWEPRVGEEVLHDDGIGEREWEVARVFAAPGGFTAYLRRGDEHAYAPTDEMRPRGSGFGF